MGTLFSTLDVARSGMQAAQVQIEVAGHNISNVNKDGYSRQRVELATRTPINKPYGQLGRGVGVSGIVRLRDGFLDQVYRQQVPGLGEAELLAQYYERIDGIFLEPSDSGFGATFDRFFNALTDFTADVEEIPVRESFLSEAVSMSDSLNDVARRLYNLETDANEELRNLVPEINSLAERIASLNVQIRDAELDGTIANDLRDDRDLLLDQLSKFVSIGYRERQDGQIDVLTGQNVLVDGGRAREIEAYLDPSLSTERNDLLSIRYKDNGEFVDVRGGELLAVFEVRDTIVKDLDSRMDDIARAIIEQINRIQSQSNGLQNWSGTIQSSNLVTDATLDLNSAGLPFNVTVPGSFDVNVYDASGAYVTTTINITAATTLNSLAADLNAVGNFSASVVNGQTLELGADAGSTYTFSNDTSHVLTALGVAGLFTGTDALTIDINQDILDNPSLLSSGYSLDVLDTGDNTAALDMAAVRDLLVLNGNAATIDNYYESTIVTTGVAARTNLQRLDVETTFVNDFEARRLQISGVSIDEEATFLIQFQRAFEGSARVITVVDRMFDALMAM